MKTVMNTPHSEVNNILVPEDIFLAALLHIEHIIELRAALYLIMLYMRSSDSRPLTISELSADTLFVDLVIQQESSLPPDIQIQDILRILCIHGILCETYVFGKSRYFLNSKIPRTTTHKRGFEKMIIDTPKDYVQNFSQNTSSQSTIFVLYEQNIGIVTPLLAEELQMAEEQYPIEWIEAAFREAVIQNKRSWKYVRSILQRWRIEGR